MGAPTNLKYTEDHEWLRIESGNIAYVGITDFAQGELGELVFIEVDTVGEDLNSGDVFGTVEAVKTTAELFLPVAGKILAFNSILDESDGDNPGIINSDPYGDGWIIKMEVRNPEELNDLMNAEAYDKIAG